MRLPEQVPAVVQRLRHFVDEAFVDIGPRVEDGGEPLRLIPVLLPGAPDPGELPPLLRTFHRIDFRSGGFDDRDARRALLQVLL